MNTAQLDQVLQLQLVVAWAGEANTDPPRLGWWRTAMCDEFGGDDLMKRLAPKTWSWVVVESARAAAKRVDNRARNRAEDPDNLLTLFRLGFEVDEQLDERLLELKQSGRPISEALPEFAELSGEWSADRFTRWLKAYGEASFAATATGRRIKGSASKDLPETARELTAALLPIDEAYPLPHFRLGR